MRDVLVFNEGKNLDFFEVRQNIIRIPEIVQRFRQAQVIWDRLGCESLDLANYMAGENDTFFKQLKLKNFATAIVQVGLLDRYLRSHMSPEFFLGTINGDSALRVALGHQSFEEFVVESQATGTAKANSRLGPNSVQELPTLSGIQLAQFALYQRQSGIYKPLESKRSDISSIIEELVLTQEVERVVIVGPGLTHLPKRLNELANREIQILESIEIDPLLSWFWRGSNNHLALAN